MANVINFLTEQFNKGIGYSALNTTRSALSTFICLEGYPAGSHPLVRRFLKGVFNIRPTFPKCETTWDTAVVMRYLKKLSPVRKLDLKFVTFKLVTLLALLITSQRCQPLHAIKVEEVMTSSSGIKIKINTLLKQSRPGKHLGLLTVRAYAPDRRLCVLTVMREYLNRTKDILRLHDKLFVLSLMAQ